MKHQTKFGGIWKLMIVESGRMKSEGKDVELYMQSG